MTIKVSLFHRSISIDRKYLPATSGLALLLFSRLVLQVLLYRAGFESFTADDFARTIVAAQWAQSPHMIWGWVWPPFHMYTVGTALRLRWELLYVPRAISILLGTISIVLMYQLAARLFNSRKIGLVSAILLAINPVHVWLSSIGTTEIFHTTFVLAFILNFILYLESRRRRYIYLSAIILAIANGFRFESWMFSIVFSLYLVGAGIIHIWRKDTGAEQPFILILVAFIPWVFPLAWLIGSYAETWTLDKLSLT